MINIYFLDNDKFKFPICLMENYRKYIGTNYQTFSNRLHYNTGKRRELMKAIFNRFPKFHCKIPEKIFLISGNCYANSLKSYI